MKRFATLPVTMLLIVLTVTSCRYRELKKDLINYEPPQSEYSKGTRTDKRSTPQGSDLAVPGQPNGSNVNSAPSGLPNGSNVSSAASGLPNGSNVSSAASGQPIVSGASSAPLESAGSVGSNVADLSRYAAPITGERANNNESTLYDIKDDTAFEAAQNQLDNLRTKWEATAKRETGFISPSPTSIDALKQARSNDQFVAKLLKQGVTLETIEVLTLLRNPSIRAAQGDLLGAVQSFTQVKNLDAVLRQYAAFTEGLAVSVGPMKGKEPPRTKFPYPGVTALKGRIAEETVRIASEKLSTARRSAVTTVRKIYWNLLFTAEARRIASETLNMFKHLESVADTRYRSGRTSFQDVNKIIIRSRLLSEELVTLGEKERNLEVGLLSMLTLPPETPVGSVAAKPPSKTVPRLGDLYQRAMKYRQEIRILGARQAKTAGMLEMAETMILPPFTLNLSSYSDAAVIQAGSAAVKPAFSVRPKLMPKPWFGTNDAWLAQTRQKLSALGERHAAAVAKTRREVRNAWFSLDLAIREEALYRKRIVGLSLSTLDVSTRGYEAGKVSFADVIQSYTGWLMARTALARKTSDIGVARASLDAATGIDSHN